MIIDHPKQRVGRGAVHRRRPDGVVEFWSVSQGFWVAGQDCRRCMSDYRYPVVTYESSWAEPVEDRE